jgi:hypothetical protein|tara:strand:+ start:191 stop:418 length:228 start_codon:yes stop_codon:yes gene_type:complete
MYGKKKMMKKGGKSNFGMLSVKAGIDNNPNPTQADRIAGATKGKKKMMMKGGKLEGSAKNFAAIADRAKKAKKPR